MNASKKIEKPKERALDSDFYDVTLIQKYAYLFTIQKFLTEELEGDSKAAKKAARVNKNQNEVAGTSTNT